MIHIVTNLLTKTDIIFVAGIATIQSNRLNCAVKIMLASRNHYYKFTAVFCRASYNNSTYLTAH